MSELKPCPFCGGEAFYIKIMGNYEKPHEIYCSKCDGAITEGRSEKQVVTNWNTRPIEDALHARIAELEEENDRLQAAWFVEETICPDGSLRPNVSDLLSRIAELEEAQRWIPVSERLPEDRVTILAAFNNREILTAKYYKYYEGFGSVENYWRIEGWHSGNVTHWMPLPEPPIVYGKECK
jgi:Lar family restriction alleviation protein